MVNALRRMHKLNALLGVRHGPGAAILPSDVSRIHMEFAKRWNDGHFGPRKFWRSCLPRLKYWNPAVPMIVNRTDDQSGPATMTIYFRESSLAAARAKVAEPTIGSSSSINGQSKAPEPAEHERTVAIDMKNQHSDVILQEFLQKTGAVPVEPTPEEEGEMEEIRVREEQAVVDRELMRQYIETQRRESSLLANARKEAAALKAAD